MMNIPKLRFLLSLAAWLTVCAACTTPENRYVIGDATVPMGDYTDIIQKWTSEAKVYSGIVSTFQVSSTMLSSEILNHQVFRDARTAHLTKDQYLDLRKKADDDSKTETSFFVALYTDKTETNDLNKPKTSWNIFLDVNGKRVMPKSIKLVFDKRDALLNRYPYLTPWSKQYMVTFPVKLDDAMEKPVTLTLASTLGAAYLIFPQ